jgi:hypothetical protein
MCDQVFVVHGTDSREHRDVCVCVCVCVREWVVYVRLNCELISVYVCA